MSAYGQEIVCITEPCEDPGRGSVDFFYRLQIGFEDFREFVTYDPLVKAQIKAQHSINAQEKLQELIDRDQPVPPEVIQRIDTKIAEAREIVDTKQNRDQQAFTPNQVTNENQAITTIRDRIDDAKSTGDVLKVRALVQEFDRLKAEYDKGNITDEQAKKTTDRLDREANSLEIVDRNCETKLNTFSLLQSDDPDRKITDYCSSLKGIDLDDARQKLLLFGD